MNGPATNPLTFNGYVTAVGTMAVIANPVTIQWRRGQVMKSADGLYAFIQTTLGYTNAQMIAAFSLMQGYAP